MNQNRMYKGKIYKTSYEWLDDFGSVIRTSENQPTNHLYRKVRVVVFDITSVEDALL